MIDLRQLRCFVVVGTELNFRRAAERLHTSQSAVSKIVAQLEATVGAPLLTRTTRRVELTAAGRDLLMAAAEVIRRADEALSSARRTASGAKGRLAIGYMDIAIIGALPNLVAEFGRTYPEIVVDLVYGWSDRQRTWLAEDRLDVGFIYGPFPTGDLERHLFTAERLVAVLPARHPLAMQAQIDVADLAGEPFVMGVRTEWRPLLEQIERLCGAAGFEPHIVQQAHFRDAIFGLVAAEVGVTLYPEAATNVPRQGVRLLPLAGEGACAEIHAAWKRDGPNPAVRTFVDFLRSRATGAASA